MKKNWGTIVSICCFIILLGGMYSCGGRINSSESLFRAIEKKYNGRWFDHIKFCRTVKYFDNNEIVKTEKWISEYKYPGQSIIKINHENSQNGYLYRNDSVYIFENNKIAISRKHKYDILIFCMDIYNIPHKNLNNSFTELGFDMKKFHVAKNKNNGNTCYVLGAEKGDLTSDQIWFNTKNLLVEKVIKNVDDGIMETCYDNYINVSSIGWVNQNVSIKVNDEMYFLGSSYDIIIPDEQKREILISDFLNNNLAIDNLLFEDFDNKYYYKCLETVSQIFKFDTTNLGKY
ncbi:MAG: hypothetical protein LBQ22_11280 [Bacteroidales bacterium]|jgi:hypothetical protein|nr:hypothetical protein [Bacteroidales bacterium]